MTTLPTRREFLARCSALALAASVAPATLMAAPPDRMVPLERISYGNFLRQLNSVFAVELANGASVELRLVEVRPLVPPAGRPGPAGGPLEESFALLFRGSRERPLAQETRFFTHPRLGSFAMFIVPIGCLDPGHWYYEAIFNRPAARPPGPRTGSRDH